MTTRPLADLAPDPENARTITGEAATGLRFSLERYGDLAGVTFNAAAKHLVTGHQRIGRLAEAGAKTWQVETPAAAKGWTPPDGDAREGVGVIEHPKTGRRFGVRLVRWTAATSREANLVANSPHIAGAFTALALPQLEALAPLPELAPLRLDVLLADLRADAPAHEVTEDVAPEPPAVAVSRTGDLWLLGAHRLLCGDSTKREDVARVMAGERAVLMATDPPYGIGIVESGLGDGRKHGRAVAPRGRFTPIAGDDRPFDPRPYLSAAPTLILWGANHYADKLPARASWLVWDKRREADGNYLSDCELAWCSVGGSVRIFRHEWKGMIRASERGEARVHPTQKPVALFAWHIENHTRAGEVCYEPFSGSGTQIVAAEQLGRRCFALEIEPRYIDVAVRRWQNLTGKDATLDGTGATFRDVARERGIAVD